mmetsp:Transcript_27547/g.70673  ORF Transcript_27547/g.70673 Transcript_27547/m.70673 type:complete len:572 (+) Transcript_27547:36-1751(+)
MDVAPTVPDGKTCLPVQVQFYFWLHNFLHLCAQGLYTDAQQTLFDMSNQVGRVGGDTSGEKKGDLLAASLAASCTVDPSEHGCQLARAREDEQEEEEEAEGEVEEDELDEDGDREDEDEESQEEDDEQQSRRRCLSAYAMSAHEYMEEQTRDADACVGSAILGSTVVLCTEVGRGSFMRATRDIIAGEVVSEQQPLTLLRRSCCEGFGPACLQCLRSVGEASGAAGGGGTEEHRAQLPPCSAARDCPNGVECDAVFCSEACAAQAMLGHHGLLCRAKLAPAQVAAQRAIDQLSKDWGNPHLSMAVQLTAGILAASRLDNPKTATGMFLGDAFQALEGKFVSASWVKLAEGAADGACRAEAMKDLAVHAEVLLGPACCDLADATAARLLLEPQALGLRIGMLGLVAIRARVDRPEVADAAAGDDAAAATDTVLLAGDTACRGVGPEDGLVPEIDASALVSFAAHCNHSCMPNLDLNFRHDPHRQGLWCIITATRAIAAGEEITIQYIPVVAVPVAQRREKLQRMWGFQCSCIRCRAEANFSEVDAAWFCSGCDVFRRHDDSGSSCGESACEE